MKELIILKIGGSCLTYKKEQIAAIREGFLERFSEEVLRSGVCNKYSVVVVHGGGSITHPLINKYGIEDELKAGYINNKSDQISSSRIHLAMNKMNGDVVGKLLDFSIPAWQFKTNSIIISFKRKIYTQYLNSLKEALNQGFIPVLHGDLNIDLEYGLSICSGDMLACFLSKKLGAKRLLFASDVDGVFSSIEQKSPLRLVDISCVIPKDILSRNVIDHSGGMIGKLDYIKKYCNDTEVFIFNGLKKDNFRKALNLEEVGSRIIY